MRIRIGLTTVLVAAMLSGCAAYGRPRADGTIAQEREALGAGAAAANVWYVPGRALVCGTSAIVAGVVMTVTFGQDYEGASELMHGGCSGPWVLTSEDVR